MSPDIKLSPDAVNTNSKQFFLSSQGLELGTKTRKTLLKLTKESSPPKSKDDNIYKLEVTR